MLGNHSLTHGFRSYLRDPRPAGRGHPGPEALRRRSPGWPPRCTAPRGSATGRGSCGAPPAAGRRSSRARSATRWRCSSRRRELWPAAVRAAAPGAMIIVHDGRESRGGFRGRSAASVGPIIDRLRRRGYGFTTVDRLLGVQRLWLSVGRPGGAAAVTVGWPRCWSGLMAGLLLAELDQSMVAAALPTMVDELDGGRRPDVGQHRLPAGGHRVLPLHGALGDRWVAAR